MLRNYYIYNSFILRYLKKRGDININTVIILIFSVNFY